MIFDKLQCPSTIDFLGENYRKGQKPRPESVMSFIMQNIQYWREKQFVPRHQELQSSSIQRSLERACNLFNFSKQTLLNRNVKIPLRKYSSVGDCKQYVFGRIGVIFPYYSDPANFVTLLLNDDLYYGKDPKNKNMNMNDLFVYCASAGGRSCRLVDDSIDFSKYFPIRIVLHPADEILFTYKLVKNLRKFIHRDAKKYQSILKWHPDWRESSILAREICQLISLFDIYIYQSTTYRNIFFINDSVVTIRGLRVIYP